jgi:hypothetical protein
LHDSPINDLRYFPEQGKLILEVDVCNDGQWSGAEAKSDPFPLTLIFTGVPQYSMNPDVLDFENDEINTERLLPSERPEKEVIEFVLFTISSQRIDDVKFLRIEAEDVYWTFS